MNSLSKAIKKQQNIFRILRLILFGSILILLYLRLTAVHIGDWDSFHLVSPISLILCLLLMPLNWWLEYKKWDRSLEVINAGDVHVKKIHSFLAGIVTGMLTPNMLGNFIGRMYYFERRDRVNVVLFTLISGHAQFLVTLIFGLAATVLAGQMMGVQQGVVIESLAIIGIPVGMVVYFQIENIIRLIYKRKGYMLGFAEALGNSGRYRTDVLLWSISRYLVFCLQFLLVLHTFGTEITLPVIYGVAQTFLIVTLIPTLFFGKLGVRESVGLAVLGSIGINEYVVVASSLLIWCVNLLIPTLISLMVCKRVEQ